MTNRIYSLAISLLLVVLTIVATEQSLSELDWQVWSDRVLGAITQSQTELYYVSEVVDGDTIKVIVNGQEETIRLLGIDTPETKAPNKPVECFGLEASQALVQLVADSPVRLETDTFQPDTDRYNRWLRHVYLSDDTYVNAYMVAEGYAQVYTRAESDYLRQLQQLQDQAQLENKGLWGQCPLD